MIPEPGTRASDEPHTETHYAIHYTSRTGEHTVEYGTDLNGVHRDYNGGHTDKAGVRQELLARKVTFGAWRTTRLPTLEAAARKASP